MKAQFIITIVGIYLLRFTVEASDPQAVYATHLAWKAAAEEVDFQAAELIWSHAPDATLVTLFGAQTKGWQQVSFALRKNFDLVGKSQLTISSLVITVKGNTASATMDYRWSILPDPQLRLKATEYYRLEEGRWKMYANDGTGKLNPLLPDDETRLRDLIEQTHDALTGADINQLLALTADENFTYISLNGTAHAEFEEALIGADLEKIGEVHIEVVYLTGAIATVHFTITLVSNNERKIIVVYDNFRLTTINFAPKPLGVEPRGRLTMMWAQIKRRKP